MMGSTEFTSDVADEIAQYFKQIGVSCKPSKYSISLVGTNLGIRDVELLYQRALQGPESIL